MQKTALVCRNAIPEKRFSSIVHIIYSYPLQSTMISGWASNVVKVNGDNIITDTKYYNIIMTQVLLGKKSHIMSNIQYYYHRTLTVTPYHTHFVLYYSVFVPLESKQRWRWQYFLVMNLSWLSKLDTFTVFSGTISSLDNNASTTIIKLSVSKMFLKRYSYILDPYLTHQASIHQTNTFLLK